MATKPTIDEQIAETEFSLKMRLAAYPVRVAVGQIAQAEADLRIANVEATIATLKFVKANAAAIRKVVSEAKAAKSAEAAADDKVPL